MTRVFALSAKLSNFLQYISQPVAFKTLRGVKVSYHLAYLADIFGALNHLKAITGFGNIF